MRVLDDRYFRSTFEHLSNLIRDLAGDLRYISIQIELLEKILKEQEESNDVAD
jgi:hypothetical protein